MRRGDVYTVADRKSEFTGKPRPAVIVQADMFSETATLLVCPITSVEKDAPLLRLQVAPSPELPLDHASWIEVDMVAAVRRERVKTRIGRLNDADLLTLNGMLATLLGLAGAPAQPPSPPEGEVRVRIERTKITVPRRTARKPHD